MNIFDKKRSARKLTSVAAGSTAVELGSVAVVLWTVVDCTSTVAEGPCVAAHQSDGSAAKSWSASETYCLQSIPKEPNSEEIL